MLNSGLQIRLCIILFPNQNICYGYSKYTFRTFYFSLVKCSFLLFIKYILNFRAICYYTTLTNFSTNYLVMCKVYTDVGGINTLYYVCLHVPVHPIIHSQKLADYLHNQADNPWYKYTRQKIKETHQLKV